jgi:alkylated DNA nucleotide flippase Atl1
LHTTGVGKVKVRFGAIYRRIYGQVSRIPKGRVATYGQIARLSGLGGQARQVGYALAALEEGARIPWHRIVNAKGEISSRGDLHGERRQRTLLSREGVTFDLRGRIPLELFLWK